MLKNHFFKNSVIESYKLSNAVLQVRLRQKLARTAQASINIIYHHYHVLRSVPHLPAQFLPVSEYSPNLQVSSCALY
jgi:hypothetical protein